MKLKKSKGYILAEILIGSVLQAVFIVSLAASVYWLTMFSLRAHYILLAREKGERIVAHIDSRIKNCGYGLWKVLQENKLMESLYYKGSNNNATPSFSIYESPIRIFESGSTLSNSSPQCGLEFSILYTKPSGLFIKSVEPSIVSNGNEFDYKIVNEQDDIDSSKFEKTTNNYNKKIKSWAVIPQVGIPLEIHKFTSKEGSIETKKFSFINHFPGGDVEIPQVSELFYLDDERFYIDAKDFCYRIMNANGSDDYGNQNPYVDGVLRIFCEYYKDTKIFNLYILSSGGERPLGMEAQQIPNNWSSNDKDFSSEWEKFKEEHIVYVTRASWKLHNIP